MTLARTWSVGLAGVHGAMVEVEVDMANGVPHVALVGLPDAVVRQSVDRVRAAVAQELATELGVSLTAIVLGYLQSQPFVTVPIVGASSIAQLQDSLAADGVRLTPAHIAKLDAAR